MSPTTRRCLHSRPAAPCQRASARRLKIGRNMSSVAAQQIWPVADNSVNQELTRTRIQRSSANPSEPIKAGGSSGEEIGPFRPARASREQLAGVPVHRVAEALLVRREVAFKHATPRPESVDAGLGIGAYRISYHLGRRRLGQLLESETVDGLAKSADFDIHIFVCSERLDRRGPAGKLLA